MDLREWEMSRRRRPEDQEEDEEEEDPGREDAEATLRP